jgi:hypothetical protein
MQTIDSTPTPESNISASSVGLRYGVILGILSIFIFVVKVVLDSNPLDNNWMNNVLNLALGIGAVVLAHRYYKTNGNGYMSYGKGFTIGFVTIVVSAVISGIFMFFYLNFIDTAAFDEVWEQARQQMEEQGQPEEAIEMGLSWGKKLFWPMFVVMGLFWAALIALIVSIFTQKKEPETAF